MSKRKYYITWYVLTASRILLWKATEPSTMPGFNRAALLHFMSVCDVCCSEDNWENKTRSNGDT